MQGLSFEQAPPISVPFRFFLTGPLFGIAAGLLLLWHGPDIFVSRWTSAVLALTHLVAVGFMLQAMCGALLQIVPVAVGANIWRPRIVTLFTHIGLTAGTVALIVAFLTESAALFRLAAPLMGLSLGAFAAVVLYALVRTPARGATLLVLRLAVIGLIVTVILGATLASAFGWQLVMPLIQLTHVHAAWGLGGWSMLLVMAVAYLVVPMFQLTPPYPRRRAWGLPIAGFILLTVWSLLWFAGDAGHWVRVVFAVAAAVVVGAFAVTTLQLQGKRRRKAAEPTLLFWRAAMTALVAAVALIVAGQVLPVVDGYSGTPFLIGTLMLLGVFMSVISGMLYKIVPFLNWLHLQNRGKPGFLVPNMKQMIPESRMYLQLKLHLISLALLLTAVVLPVLVYPAALAFIASCVWLEWNLVAATRLYRRVSERVEQTRQAQA
jgi:hypothetical protein